MYLPFIKYFHVTDLFITQTNHNLGFDRLTIKKYLSRKLKLQGQIRLIFNQKYKKKLRKYLFFYTENDKLAVMQ